MGMKNLFKRTPKDATPEQLSEVLAVNNVPTAPKSARGKKFGAYSEYAQQLSASRGSGVPMPGSGPGGAGPNGGYGNVGGGPADMSGSNGYGAAAQPMNSNPYASAQSGGAGGYGNNSASNPYQTNTASPYASGSVAPNPYAAANNNNRSASPVPSYHTYDQTSSSPYAQASNQYSNKYNGSDARSQLFNGAQSQAQDTNGNPNSAAASNPYGQSQQGSSLSGPSRAALFGAAMNAPNADDQQQSQYSPYAAAYNSDMHQNKQYGTPASQQRFKTKPAEMSAEEELMYAPSDLNVSVTNSSTTNNGYGGSNDYSERDEEQDKEDEDVEAIKTQMKFLRREDVNLTRSALRSAAMAEESGRNALGMLGAQGESLYETESSIELAKTQNKIAAEKTRELRTLNQSMFRPHVSNPFNSKRRLQEKEEQIKAERMRQQMVRENLRKDGYSSQQRVMDGLGVMPSAHKTSETAKKYDKYNKERQKYLFEGDEEDDALEDEIEGNLDALHSASKRLNKLAIATHEELESQNKVLNKLGDTVDDLDVNIHLNSHTLMNIR